MKVMLCKDMQCGYKYHMISLHERKDIYETIISFLVTLQKIGKDGTTTQNDTGKPTGTRYGSSCGKSATPVIGTTTRDQQAQRTVNSTEPEASS